MKKSIRMAMAKSGQLGHHSRRLRAYASRELVQISAMARPKHAKKHSEAKALHRAGSGRVGLILLLALLTSFASACGGSDENEDSDIIEIDTSIQDEPDTFAEEEDETDTDVSSEVAPETDAEIRTDPDECDPNCHWDCFGGVVCSQSSLYLLGYGARPCCHFGDPWPGEGPACSFQAFFNCPEGSCTNSRYSSCFTAATTDHWSSVPFQHLHPTYCENGMKQTGDSCSTDDDCRPSLDGERLECDESGSCSAAPRPPAPEGYAQPCGLALDDLTPASSDVIVQGVGCEWCHALLQPGDECVRQSCTMTCLLDEDCPEGSVCLCFDDPRPHQFCVQTTDRQQVTDWLTCP